jgi:hypothetical protein
MQDRTSANSMKVLLQRTAGPYIWLTLPDSSRTSPEVREVPGTDSCTAANSGLPGEDASALSASRRLFEYAICSD